MPDEFGTEVSLLLLQAREYARYFGELGADVIDPSSNSASRLEPAVIIADSTIVEARVSKPAAAPQPTLPTASTVSPQFARAPSANIIHASPQDSLFAVAEATGAAPQSTETLEDIWANIGECTRCALCSGRTQVVNTHGNPKARLMFVGEAPGADEDAQGKPFVGRAGQLLTKMIEAMGMKREDVIIGNVNRCRPPGNRQPTLEEAAICRPFLFREIAAVRPEVIVVMGNTALRNLLEIREGITRVRGQFQDFQGIKVMPTFHPAYLLRDPSKKRETWDDLKKVMEYLDSRPNQR